MIDPTITACASAPGGLVAVVRLSGPRAFAIAAAAGIKGQHWSMPGGDCPIRVLNRHGPATATGYDLVEILLPGSPDLVERALSALLRHGATAAGPGSFTRQAVARGRLTLDRAEAVLALAQSTSAAGAQEALQRLRGALGDDLAAIRDQLLELRARIEAGLDFLDEDDVRGIDGRTLEVALHTLRQRIARWQVAADSCETMPTVCLVGRANAGKSALFAALSGAPALVSPIPGTTRDPLEAMVDLDGIRIRLVDTAGWDGDAGELDGTAIRHGRDQLTAARLIVACSAPDAPLPERLDLPPRAVVVVATKDDLGLPADTRAVLTVSVTDGRGIAGLRALIARHIGTIPCEPRQQRLLAAAAEDLDRAACAPADELLADDLRRAADHLGELIGSTTSDEVLDAVFSRFCIGK